MRSTSIKIHLFMIGMLLTGQSCTAAPPTDVLHILEPVTPAPSATPFVQPPTELPATPTDVPAQPVQHTTVPVSLAAEGVSHAADFDSSKVSPAQPIIGGDRFTHGQFERPFNADTMDGYYASLDILSMFASQDDTWIYGTMQLSSREADPSLIRRYALELDVDHDGRGDWLVVTSNPTSTDWMVEGVKVYQDANGDVGSVTAMYADENTSGDGYETLVFDQGSGSDPDAAWARTSPINQNVVEISVKRSVLGNPGSFLIGMWAGSSLLDPALFDLNDHFTHDQAGAADSSYQAYFPIKAVAEIDGTCRLAVGFQTGKELGLCKSESTTVNQNNKGSTGSGSENGSEKGSGGGSENGGSDPTPIPNDPSCPPCLPGQDQQNPWPDCTCSTS